MIENIKELIRTSKIYKLIKSRYLSVKFEDFDQPILNQNETDELLKKLLSGSEPVMFSRLGSVELNILKKYYKKKKYGKKEYTTAISNAGVFPTSKEVLDDFSQLYLECIPHIDLLGIWSNPFEDIIANTICPNAQLTILRFMEPFLTNEPWTQHLRGKKVLVVNPFAATIEKQYKKRETLFDNQKILPPFELITYKAVQSVGGNPHYASWFDALAEMKKDISKIDFDIAIIGAGAYGLPLACFIKELGRKAVHLGGATQLLFGIYGRRWEQNEKYKPLIKSSWTRPSEEEKPEAAKNVENACYW